MVSRHHLIGWQRCAAATVVAVCDPDLARARAAASEFDLPTASASLEDALAAGPVDAVDITAPMVVHPDLVAIAAAHGAAVICQKPLAATPAAARAILAALPPGVRLVVHENWRFRAPYRRIKALLDAGLIGAPVQFAMTHYGSGHSPASGDPPAALVRQPFMATLPRLLVYETLIHHLDTLAFLLGPLTLTGARVSRAAPTIAGEDGASVLLTAGPVHGTLSATTACPAAPVRAVDTVLINGTEGALLYDGTRLTLTRIDGMTEQETFDPQTVYQASYDQAIRHYAHCLLTGEPFESPPAEHIAILDLAEAIYAANSS
jgi:predicted dehydrogenase